MQMKRNPLWVPVVVIIILSKMSCYQSTETVNTTRNDGAVQLDIALTGSLQNPAWSPDGNALLFTRFQTAYNEEPADLFIVDFDNFFARELVSDGSGNVNLPGSVWNKETGLIVFSSSREPHDEIFTIDEDGFTGDEIPITARDELMAYEPSISPNGRQVVFESHLVDQEDFGVITVFQIDGSGNYRALTDVYQDCRQPNWSPAGDKIVYQCLDGGVWNIWTIGPDGTSAIQITSGPGDKTDASFSPDGEWVVYSSDEQELESANIFVIPSGGGESIRVTDWEGYDGAPAFSPDGSKIVFESFPGDPDGSSGATIWMIASPV